MESDVKVTLPLWRWQAVKRKIRKRAKEKASEALQICRLELPHGLEACPVFIGQALAFRRRLSEALKLHADLLAAWTRLCEKTGAERLRRGIRDMACQMRPIAPWMAVDRWGCGERRKDHRHNGAYRPGGRSGVKRVLEIRSGRGSQIPVVAFEEAERMVGERIESEGTLRFVKGSFDDDGLFFEEGLFIEMNPAWLDDPEDDRWDDPMALSHVQGKWYKLVHCVVRAFDEKDLERLEKQEQEEEKRAIELLEAIGKAWDAPFTIDLPAWLVDLLQIEADPDIRVTCTNGRIRTSKWA